MKLGPKMKKPEDQHGNQGCPSLNLHGIATSFNKGFDLEVLLQVVPTRESFSMALDVRE